MTHWKWLWVAGLLWRTQPLTAQLCGQDYETQVAAIHALSLIHI